MADAKHGTTPIVVDETPGKKAYCTCGFSLNLPYCDGAHSKSDTGLTPMVVEIEEAGKKAICQCHKSCSMPFCDGTHSKL